MTNSAISGRKLKGGLPGAAAGAAWAITRDIGRLIVSSCKWRRGQEIPSPPEKGLGLCHAPQGHARQLHGLLHGAVLVSRPGGKFLRGERLCSFPFKGRAGWRWV